MNRLLASAALLGCVVVACGGAKSPPKDEGEAAGTAAPAGDDTAAPSASASSAATDDKPAPAASSAPAAKPADTSGDLKPASGDDPWLAAHQMPPKDVMSTMKAANAKVQACWKAGLKRDPSTTGEVKIRFVITNDGKVRAWRDDGSSMSDEEVTQCVGGVVEKLGFPKQKSPGDAWGVYSIHFQN